MRLVCPNCEAKYEVPEDAIPETGRDVQCANCGHAWYQMRPRSAVTETAAAATVAAPEPKPTPEPDPEPEAASVPDVTPEPVARLEPGPEPEVAEAVAAAAGLDAGPALPDVDAAVGDAVEQVAGEMPPTGADTPVDVAEAAPGPVAAVPVAAGSTDAEDLPETADEVGTTVPAAAGSASAAYAVDDSVLAILREEAEREALARKAEAARPLEVQADLGLEAAIPAARKPVENLSLIASPSGASGEDADDRGSARKARLPDVEEINSTLRPGEHRVEAAAAEAMPDPVEGRSSFRKGFLMVMTFAILGAALYVSADALAAAVPALAGVLKAYVGFVDSLRLQLDGLMQSATVAINGT